ncbi:MAG: MOSC domain-containing protein [Actinomycetia bacterium]|nr:MOSC domain-containing protein [Actinomycetes bacterium]
MTVRLSGITLFPVKSTRGQSVTSADLEALGLRGDRRWMVVGLDGECLTARTDRNLLRLSATDDGASLRLRAPDTEITVAYPAGSQIEVTVHGRPAHGIPAAQSAQDWVRRALGRDDARLVHLARPRPLNPDYSQVGDATGFADGYPVTLASTASLRRLQDWVSETALERGEDPIAIAMDRFRPNLVIENTTADGDLAPFEEDTWTQVRIGGVDFDVAKPIDRCVLTTIDPDTLEKGAEPIRTLARHRAWDGKTWFGLQLIPRSTGTLRVGDSIVPQAKPQSRAASAAS